MKNMREPAIRLHDIGGKRIFVFENHNEALIPWAEIRRELPEPPRLFTLDHHTDVHYAFRQFVCKGARPGDTPESLCSKASELAREVRFDDPSSVSQAAIRLAHDEQIDAAITAGILDIAFVAAYSDGGHIESNEQHALNERVAAERVVTQADGTKVSLPFWKEYADPPFSYSLPNNRIVILPKADLGNELEGDEADVAFRDAAIEDLLLGPQLLLIDQICKSTSVKLLAEAPYLLDIDLDYFNTRKAVSPSSSAIFSSLVRGAAAITIARESSCVKSCQIDGENLTSEFLEESLLRLIRTTLES
jgi:hypothetical protein